MSSITARLSIASLMAITVGAQEAPAAKTNFDLQEKQQVINFWKEPGRYSVSFPEQNLQTGIYEARLTAEGSVWLREYRIKSRANSAKTPPGQPPAPANARQKAWDAWVDTKYDFDEDQALVAAHIKNQASLGKSLPAPKLNGAKNPPPMPADLKALIPPPPQFVKVVTPRKHTVNFGDHIAELNDNTKVRKKYAYFRFHEGVMDPGKPMRGQNIDQLKPLFQKAGITDSELKVMAAVSLLEGGFDSLNTYDTGYVSVGFIQFACLSGGGGSLGQVMLDMKNQNPQAFQKDFRNFGLDVNEKGEMVALNLQTGDELTGSMAANRIISDVRLAATFLRAGRLSEPFRLAQIRVAKDLYYPAEDTVSIKLGNKTQTAKIKDLFKTEAALATLMDRKVNTGSYGDLEKAITGLMLSYNLKDIKDISQLEQEVTQLMRYRKSYLSNPDLSQPKPSPLTSNRRRS